MYLKFFKRFFDICLAFIALVCLSPLLVIVTTWLYFTNRGTGVFFIQERPGQNARIFKLIKFKTMTDDLDSEGKLLPDSERLTEAGRFIRSTSIDELPQLFNVLKGDMAVVGPRPLLIKYLPLYSKNQARRHEVKPGLTGWAQCNGRNAISWKEKFELDLWYVDHVSLLTDLRIILLTIKIRENKRLYE